MLHVKHPLGASAPKRHLVALAAALAMAISAMFGLTTPTWAQSTYPNRPLRMIVPYAPGGATDIVARLVSQQLSAALKQAVTVENRAGANGMIGTEAVARAAPDGYTLLMNTAGAQTLNTVLYKANYDAVKSFEPISQIANIGFVIVVHPSVPAKTIQEYIALARAKTQPMNVSTGTAMIELLSEKFKSTAGLPDLVNVPYKGTGPQMTAVVGGEVGMTIDPFTGLQMIKAGKVRALAVLSANRSPALPDVPTLQEAGILGMNFNSWAGLLAPAGTPKDIVTRLHAEVSRIVDSPDMRARLAALDYEVVNSTPEQFTANLTDETARWAKLVKDSNYKVAP